MIENITNCYIHIPFCNSICSYCDFCKMFYNTELVNKYLDKLEEEINSIYSDNELETIYIGGGTPSCLNYSQLKRLFDILNKFHKTSSCSITIECNFDSIDYKKIDLFKENGVNRLSFGLESINRNNLKLMERNINKEHVISIIDYCNKIGINDINIDLIYALPNENIEILKDDLDFITDLNITHISTYSLIIEKNTKLYINNYKNIDEDLDASMYEYICDYLRKKDYIHYEISNFCKKGYESKHNLCYWKNSNYYGFGLGASSYINNYRITNTKSINNYLKNQFIYKREKLNNSDIIEYEVILNLRTAEGIDLLKFKEKYNIDLINYYDYSSLLKNKLLILENNNLFIDEEKLYISNEIILKLLDNKVEKER